MIAAIVRWLMTRRHSVWCRIIGHMWWSEDFDDDVWGQYEMVTCRRCGDWMFAQ